MGDVARPPPPVSAPVPLDDSHDVNSFDCGKEPLDDWLRRRAIKSEGRSARCFVITEGKRVIGYYSMAAGGVERESLPGRLRRNMPETVPAVIIARLAIDRAHQGLGLGRALLKDALLRTLSVSKEIGVRAVLVHAIDGDIVPFYSAYGFIEFPAESRTLFLPIETIGAGL